jgi:hypothetical protein
MASEPDYELMNIEGISKKMRKRKTKRNYFLMKGNEREYSVLSLFQDGYSEFM